MPGGLTRRRLLWGAASTLGVVGTVARTGRAYRQSEATGFAPASNGFGFRNWSPSDQYFEAPPNASRAEIQEHVRTGWRDEGETVLDVNTRRFPRRLIEAISTQLRQAVVQRAGTNGHCYGMVLTAQRYYERPETIPVDRPVASEIEDPTVPVDEPTAPVYEDIVESQAAQYLRFRPWLGRRAMLHPDWIDTGAVVRDAESVVDTFGTAALMLFDGSLYAHQVLAHDVEERGDTVAIRIYDPNRPAVGYRSASLELLFDRDGETMAMRPHGRYTGVLFNRYDRIERSTGRDHASPLDHLTVGPSTVRSSLFPVALVLADTEDVDLAVVAPDGTELERIRGTHMDSTRGSYARVRSLYGADPGTYRIGVFGDEATDYQLKTVVADPGGTIVDETHSASIEVGELHEYDLNIPAEGDGKVASADDGRLRGSLVTGGAAFGGVAAGALGYRAIRRRRKRIGSEQPQT